jgi:glucokinase
MPNAVRYAVGIDFGGTSVKLALVDDAGTIHAQRKIPTTDLPDQPAWLDAMAKGVRELATQGPESQPATLAGVGIGVPGFVDHRRGFIHDLPNVPGWTGVPLAGRMEERVNLPVLVDNDVNVMATGECLFGAGRAYQHVVFLTLGTGVGGALLLHNRIYRGARSMAGEIGHMTIDLHGIQTPTGQGGLEQYVGNQRIVERALRYLKEGRPSILDTLCKGDRSSIGPLMIEQAAEQGDELSIAVYDEVADCLAAGLASVAYLIQPQAFIIGGGVGQSGPILYGPLRKHLHERLSPHFAEHIVIKKAALGTDAGVIGAATLVLQD